MSTTYKIIMVSERGGKCDFATGFKTIAKAIRFKKACENNGVYIDKFKTRWTLYVVEGWK